MTEPLFKGIKTQDGEVFNIKTDEEKNLLIPIPLNKEVIYVKILRETILEMIKDGE